MAFMLVWRAQLQGATALTQLTRAVFFLSYLLCSHDSRVSFCLFPFANKLTNLVRVPECCFQNLDVSRRLRLLSTLAFHLKTASFLIATKLRSNCLADTKEISMVATVEAIFSKLEFNSISRENILLLENVFASLVLDCATPVFDGLLYLLLYS